MQIVFRFPYGAAVTILAMLFCIFMAWWCSDSSARVRAWWTGLHERAVVLVDSWSGHIWVPSSKVFADERVWATAMEYRKHWWSPWVLDTISIQSTDVYYKDCNDLPRAST